MVVYLVRNRAGQHVGSRVEGGYKELRPRIKNSSCPVCQLDASTD